jgi:hypothetical protein
MYVKINSLIDYKTAQLAAETAREVTRTPLLSCRNCLIDSRISSGSYRNSLLARFKNSTSSNST